jgi:hypothetical protein
MGMAALWGAVHRTHTGATCRLLAHSRRSEMSALMAAVEGRADHMYLLRALRLVTGTDLRPV